MYSNTFQQKCRITALLKRHYELSNVYSHCKCSLLAFMHILVAFVSVNILWSCSMWSQITRRIFSHSVLDGCYRAFYMLPMSFLISSSCPCGILENLEANSPCREIRTFWCIPHKLAPHCSWTMPMHYCMACLPPTNLDKLHWHRTHWPEWLCLHLPDENSGGYCQVWCFFEHEWWSVADRIHTTLTWWDSSIWADLHDTHLVPCKNNSVINKNWLIILEITQHSDEWYNYNRRKTVPHSLIFSM